MGESVVIDLVSSDGTIIQIPLEIAIQSPILKNLLTNDEFIEAQSKTVNLPTISSTTLNQVIEYLYHRKRMEKEDPERLDDFSVDPKDAVELLQAADFLDI